MARDHVTEHALGFDCIVNGRRFGTWRSRGEALAGMKTEQLRAIARAAAESADKDIGSEK